MVNDQRKHIDLGSISKSLQTTLSNRKNQTVNLPSAKKAGVLIILYNKNNEPHLIFTKRTLTVANHKGQISFPGGTRDEHDKSILDTALRETREEIGINVERKQVLGALDDVYTSVGNYIVSPYIASMPKLENIKLSEREIDRLIEIPLRILLDPSNKRKNTRMINGVPRTIKYYAYSDEEIWGLTAKILDQFLNAVKEAYRTNTR